MNYTRKKFLSETTAFVAVPIFGAYVEGEEPVVRFGMVTDIHHADKDDAPWNDRVMYRRSAARLKNAVETFGARKVDFMIDFRDIVFILLF